VAEIPETGFFTMEKVERKKKKRKRICVVQEKGKKQHTKKDTKNISKNYFDMQITVNA
jgi:DNA replication protein DnaD